MALPSRLLLRPAVLASVLAHGGLVAAGLFGLGEAPLTRPATITGFVSEAWSGAEDADATPWVPEVAREVEAVTAEPRPAEATVEEELPPDLPWPDAPPTETRSGFGGVPVGLRTRAETPPAPSAAPPPAPVAVPQVAQRAGGGPTRGAVRVGNHKPPYPREALARGWQGVARVVVDVREDGTVGGVRLAESSGYALLDDAALAAARAWRYEPRLVDGVPAPDLLKVPVVFRIR
jgi:protein TonB